MSVLSLRTLRSWMIWVLIGLAYLWRPMHIDFYCDEGYFAEMASRVLRGELPNVDFSSNYPGLFHWINAAWFQLLGQNLLSMRLGMMVLLATVFFPTVYRLSRLLLPPIWAMVTTGMVMTLAFSMNTTVSGNWYGLTFATLALYGLLTQRAWLCGLALGLCFCLKQSMAIYTGMAFLMILAQSRAWHWPKGLKIFLCGLMLVYVLVVFRMLLAHPSIGAILMYLIPTIGVMFQVLNGISQENDQAKTIPMSAVWIGFAFFFVPVVLCLLPYLARNALMVLIEQIFVVYPGIYLERAYLPYTNFFEWPSLFLWLGFWVQLFFWRDKSWLKWGVLGLCILLLLRMPIRELFNATSIGLMQIQLWMMAIGLWVYRLPTARAREPMVYACWVWGVFLFLNTFPLGMPFYYAYTVMPFLIVGVVWLQRWFVLTSRPARVWLSGVLAYLILFGAMVGYRQLGWYQDKNASIFPVAQQSLPLPGDRGKLMVSPGVGMPLLLWYLTVKSISQRPDDVFLFSDAPIIYFLTEHINPTRYSYALDSSVSDGQDIIADLEKHQVQWVLVDKIQNGFEQPLLIQYMFHLFVYVRTVDNTTLLFQRKPAH